MEEYSKAKIIFVVMRIQILLQKCYIMGIIIIILSYKTLKIFFTDTVVCSFLDTH